MKFTGRRAQKFQATSFRVKYERIGLHFRVYPLATFLR